MNNHTHQIIHYIYIYSYHEDERSLCQLEMRSLFGFDTHAPLLKSTKEIEASRSPFIKERLDVLFTGKDWRDIVEQTKQLPELQQTFKVYFFYYEQTDKIAFEQRKQIEREIGLSIRGSVDLKQPQQLFGILKGTDGWHFGIYKKSEAVWLKHQQKPHNYSTALSTRVARAVVNIAIPSPSTIKAIDPCCGIGTVLIEALSMGVDIVGSDLNPLTAIGARENLAFFGFVAEVRRCDIRDVSGHYDVAIIDMPYNLCSVLTAIEQLEMLKSARKFTKKMVVVTVESIDTLIEEAGFSILDRCVAKKSKFTRQILVCE